MTPAPTAGARRTAPAPADEGSVALPHRLRLVGDAPPREGALRVCFCDGQATVEPSGQRDLDVTARGGKLRVVAAQGIVGQAGRVLTLAAARAVRVAVDPERRAAALAVEPRTVHLRTPTLAVTAARARLHARAVRVTTRSLRVVAEEIVIRAACIERLVRRLVERVEARFVDTATLRDTRAGRMRCLVRQSWALRSRATDLASRGETFIDGEQIVVG